MNTRDRIFRHEHSVRHQSQFAFFDGADLVVSPCCHYSIIPLFHYSIIPLFHYSIIPLFHYSIIQLFHG